MLLKKPNLARRISPRLVIFLPAVISSFFMCFNTGLYFDGWLWAAFFNGMEPLLQNHFIRGGLPQAIYFYDLINLLPSFPHNYKVIGFLSHLSQVLLIYEIINNLNIKAFRKISLITALIYGCNPFLISPIEITHIFYSICFSFLLLGFYILFFTEWRRSIRHLLSLLLFLASFTTNSMLVIYLALFLLFYFDKNSSLFVRETLKKNLTVQNFCHLALPFLYFLSMSFLFPKSGDRINYNDLNYNLFEVAYLYLKVPYELIKLVGLMLDAVVSYPIPYVGSVIVMFFLLKICSERVVKKIDFQTGSKLIIGALFLLLSVICPYALVQKGFAIGLNQDRQNFLLSLPLSVITASILSFLDLSARRKCLITSLLVGGLLVSTNSRLIDWQVRAVKDESIKLVLSDHIDRLEPDVVFVDDQTSFDKKFEDRNWYIPHYLSGYFATKIGKFSIVGVPTQADLPKKLNSKGCEEFLKKYALTYYFDKCSLERQSLIRISPTNAFIDNWRLLQQFYLVYLFGNTSEQKTFLNSLVVVKNERLL